MLLVTNLTGSKNIENKWGDGVQILASAKAFILLGPNLIPFFTMRAKAYYYLT